MNACQPKEVQLKFLLHRTRPVFPSLGRSLSSPEFYHYHLHQQKVLSLKYIKCVEYTCLWAKRLYALYHFIGQFIQTSTHSFDSYLWYACGIPTIKLVMGYGDN